MLKNQRLDAIVQMVNTRGSVKVSDIMKYLDVSDMTVRRDLQELEESGELKRVHGGATSIHNYPVQELSHIDKQIIHLEEKTLIAKVAADLVEEGDTLFIGPGTTMELFAEYVSLKNIRIVTNCWPVFKKLVDKDIEAILLGGKIRKKTEAFVGDIPNSALEKMRFNKAFVSANGVLDNQTSTSTTEEGRTLTLALDHSAETYLLIDASKLNRRDFISFYNIEKFTNVITNKDSRNKYKALEKYVPILLVD